MTPASAKQRQYEALRAFFVEGRPSREVARAFGYSTGSFQVLCHHFRRETHPVFFVSPRPGPRDQPKKSAARDLIVELRKRNYSVYEISESLKERQLSLSPTAVREVLRVEGFAPLPRRADEERPDRPRATVEAVADVRRFAPVQQEFQTRCGGLFLFVPYLVRLSLEKLATSARLRGTKMIPAAHALRASLALKLWSIERKSHVMALVADQGLALFAGLNAFPKKSYLSEYSSHITHTQNTALLAAYQHQIAGDELLPGRSFNLDFHSVPYYGEHPVIERHYVSMRSRRQSSILTFLAQDADGHAFCYANADLRKGEEAEEIFRFISFWEKTHGERPRHLVFDSQLTTYANLARLEMMDITFMTLRRRSAALLKEVMLLPRSAWRTIELDVPARKFRTPRVFEQTITLAGASSPTVHPGSRSRGAHNIADQRPQEHTYQADHPLRAAYVDRERALRRGALLSHGCAVLSRRPESGLRYVAARHRQRPVSIARQNHAWLRRRPGSNDLSRSHRHPRHRGYHGHPSAGPLPPSCSPADRASLRITEQTGDRPMVERHAARPDRVTRKTGLRLRVISRRGNPG